MPKPANAKPIAAIQVLCLPDRRGQLDEPWLAHLRERLPEAELCAKADVAALHGLTPLTCLGPDPLQWPVSEQGLLVLRNGLHVPEHLMLRLRQHPAWQQAAMLVLPGNHHADLNPAAGLPLSPESGWSAEGLDSLAAAATTLQSEPLHKLVGDAFCLTGHGQGLRIVDNVWLHDPKQPLNAGHLQQPSMRRALGAVRLKLLAWQQEGVTALPYLGLDGQPVTLHITHSWGGGIERWVTDQVRSQPGHSLVLSSHGQTDGFEHGQTVQCFAMGPNRGLIHSWTLSPTIRSTAIDHPQYNAHLQWLIQRYGVARIMVSSLIGHSLDALRQAAPTAQILHDVYPASPVLDVDPLPFYKAKEGLDLAALLAASAETPRFIASDLAQWPALRAAWQKAVQSNAVHLIAPTQHVASRWSQLFDDKIPSPVVIAHGFDAPWPTPRQAITGQARADGKLNLVVIGRLGGGKGLRWLREHAEAITARAHLTLLGTGEAGRELFGQVGMDVVMDFSHQTLPTLLKALKPQAALFLSTVPETWNYVLSEIRSLGLTPIAPALGSFAERIENGKDGLLYPPNPEGLIDCLAELQLGQRNLPQAHPAQPEPSLVDSHARYSQVLVASPRDGELCAPAPSTLSDLDSDLADLQLAQRHDQQTIAALRKDLRLRSDWAQRQERLAQERTEWAKAANQALQRAQQDLEEVNAQAKQLHDELKLRTEWALSQEKLAAERTAWAQASNAALDDAQQELSALSAQAKQLHNELKLRTEWALSQEKLAAERTAWAQASNEALEDTRQQLQASISRSNQLQQDLTAAVQARDLLTLQRDQLQADVTVIIQSRSWRLTRPLRVVARVLRHLHQRRAWHPNSWSVMLPRLWHRLRGHGWRATLEAMQYGGPATGPMPLPISSDAAPTSQPLTPVHLPSAKSAAPRASVIIPVYNQVHYTAACLRSLAAHAADIDFEVIVVDDCSSDDTADFLARCTGIKVITQSRNGGFIASCNRGAAAATGDVLVFLNNDTTVTAGWLAALLDSFELFPQAGVVGGRLIYPDGRLQEAGGIIFSDGSGWNYGRLDHPHKSQYSFASATDYVSGACLAVPKMLFETMGGFDPHYTPAYYEDTDLCFKVAEAGYSVIMQPACTIVHHEGVTSGTSETAGIKRHQAINRDRFRARWADRLAQQPAPVAGPQEVDAVDAARFRRLKGWVLVVDATLPEPDHDSGSVRMLAMLELLRDLGYRVTFVPANLAWSDRYSTQLQRRGIEVLHHPMIASIEDWLADHGQALDLVMVSRHYILTPLLPKIRQHCPDAKLVFDTVDLHYLREQRQAELSQDASMARTAAKTREAELKLIQASDVTLVVSEVEQALLAKEAPQRQVRILSNIHEPQAPGPNWSSRSGLLFVGGFQHPPNVDAAEWLIEAILPAIRAQLPEVELHLIGSRMPDSLKHARCAGLQVHGYVEDLTPFLRSCRVSVAPLRYGAGVKGKVNQAMAYGLPVVATRCAAEGLGAHAEHDILIADDSQTFADQVVRLHEDERLWQSLAEAGRRNIALHFSREAARQQLARLLVD